MGVSTACTGTKTDVRPLHPDSRLKDVTEHAEGRTKKEILRCLKRYGARQAPHAILHDLTQTKQRRPTFVALIFIELDIYRTIGSGTGLSSVTKGP